jgi:DNA primase
MSDNNIIKEIVEQADIVSIIGKYIKLTPKGKDFIGICPFHHDTSPSLSVSPSRKMFKCFVCGVGGDVIKFVEKFEKISYSEALKKVAKLINYEIKNTKYSDPKKEKDTKILNTANDYFQRILFNEENKKFLDYLYKRGLNDKDISFFNLGFGGENNVIYKLLSNKNNNLKFNQNNFNDQELKDAGLISINKDGEANFLFNNRIIFPIFDASNSLVGFSGRIIEKKSDASKYQNSPNSYIFSKEKILYNMNNAKNNLKNEIVICEGYMDTIAYYKSDIKNVVATMGLFLSNYTISLIKSYENIKTVVLSFDSDNAGINTTINNARKLIDNGYIVLVVEDFSNIAKDMDEVLIKFGKEKVNEFFNNKTDYIY